MSDKNLLAYIVAKLKSHTGSWPKIAEKTGVPYFTISKIASGVTKDPRISNVQALVDYFREEDEQTDKHAA